MVLPKRASQSGMLKLDMKKQWDLKSRKLVQLVNFKKPYQIVSSQAVSFSQGWTHLKIGRMNMTNLDFVFGCFCFRVSVKKTDVSLVRMDRFQHV